MKIRLYLCTCALLLACAAAGFADEVTDQYSMLMKPAAAANAALQKNLTAGDWAAAATSAIDVQNGFAKIEVFWAMRGVGDAQGFAKAIQAAAMETHNAAVAGNADAAKGAAMKIGVNCGMCHMAHRTRNPDGTFTLKQ